MKTIFLITICALMLDCLAQDFPVGAYILTDSSDRSSIDYQEIEDMGVNWVIAYYDNTTMNSLSDFNVIAWNADSPNDYIYHYTGGYYTKWEAEDSVHLDYRAPGVRHDGGEKDGNYWKAASISDYGKHIVRGPYYVQAKEYHLIYDDERINYKVNFNMKVVGDVSSHDPVCKILVTYTVVSNDVQYEDTITSKVLYADSMSNSFDNYSLTYSVPESVHSIPTDLMNRDLPIESNSQFLPYGTQFKVQWLDDSETRELLIDYIEVSENKIWGQYLSNPTYYNSQIEQYADNHSGNNLKFWYSVDEPVYIDQYEPSRRINQVLTDSSYPGLISAFYPQAQCIQNNEVATNRFLDVVEPQQLMIDYYPFWPNKRNDQGLSTQRYTHQRFWGENKNLNYHKNSFFIAQAHAFWDEDMNVVKRWPEDTELKANVMLALAHGVKGIFFWNYFSYNYDKTSQPRVQGIILINGGKSDLYHEIKNNIAPRLKGKLGNTLLKLDYEGEYAFDWMNSAYNIDSTADSLSNLDIDYTAADSAFFHVGRLLDSTDTGVEYYMAVNLICAVDTMKRELIINLSNPPSSSNNMGFTSVEYDTGKMITFNSNTSSTHTDTIQFDAGEGILFRYGAVTKYGGLLTTDETVTSAKTLLDTMIIEDGATLTLNDIYSTNSKIRVEDGGLITANLHGGLDFDQTGSMYYEDWSDGLVIRQDSSHPKLQWTEFHPTTSSIKYKIYRKKDTPNFVLIQTINSKSITEFIDEDVTISFQHHSNETTADYYIVAVEGQERDVWADVDTTITARVDTVIGNGYEKRNAEGEEVNLLPKEYSLSGNYPNPFNPSTTIKYALPEISDVRIEIFDITGRLVKDFGFGSQSAGYKETVWHGDNNNGIKVSSGIYIMRFKAAAVKGNRSFLKSHKLVLVK